jgi:hypothetical protein
MKRYALFVCEQEAANGGWGDFRRFFDRKDEAADVGLHWVLEEEGCEFAGLMDWHVVDMTVGTVVAQGNCLTEDFEHAVAVTTLGLSKSKGRR